MEPMEHTPPIYRITGIMASGKSTVAALLARRLERAVHLRGDVFRKTLIPYCAPKRPMLAFGWIQPIFLRNRR